MDNKSQLKSEISDRDVMELTWKYFAHHGNQRLTHINFFTVLSSALIILQFTIINSQEGTSYIPAAIGVIQCIIAFVFYKIDERTMFLVKGAEEAMKEIERHYSFYNNKKYSNSLKIFTNEVVATKSSKQNKCFLTGQISHRISYRILLSSFSAIGILGGILGFIKYLK